MKRVVIPALAVTSMITGTVAYLTSTDQDVNVMTLGNVEIEQLELQRAEGVEYAGLLEEGDLVPFEQGQALYPAVGVGDGAYTAEGDDNLLYWGPYVTAESEGAANGAGNGL